MNSQLGKIAHVRAYDVMAGYRVGERVEQGRSGEAF